MRPRHKTRGFSLLEIAIVLAIIGTLLAGSIVIGLGGLEASRYNATVRRMDEIHKALLAYSTVFDRLPCPSSLALTSSNANYGIEAANKGTCTGGTPAANFTASSGTVEGGLPTRTLHLPDEYQFDAWGRRFRYAVNPDYTADDSLPVGTGNCTSTKAITVKDAGAGDRSTNAAYALISHGANGHGGYTRNGVVFNAGSTNTDEQTNCHCNTLAAATTYSPTYVQKLPTESSTSASNVFDDITTYREAWQLQTLASPLASTSCGEYLYVNDVNNCRVQVFDTSGNFIRKFGSCGTGDSQFGWISADWGMNTIAVDSSGYIWVADQGNELVKKFDASGNPVASAFIGDTYWGSGTMRFANLLSVFIDSSGNIFTTDYGAFRIKKHDSTGAFVASYLGSASCNSCVNTSTCAACEDTSSPIYPREFHLDDAGNFWTIDRKDQTVKKYNSSGTLLMTYGTGGCGSSSGYFGCSGDNAPSGFAIDESGNVYASDSTNYRVQIFDSGGTFIRQLGCSGSSACSQGNAAGQFDYPHDVDIDSSGNVWVVDSGNNRIVKFDSSGNYLMTIPSDCASSTCAGSSSDGRFDSVQEMTISVHR